MRSIPAPLVLDWPLEGATTELVLPEPNSLARIFVLLIEYVLVPVVVRFCIAAIPTTNQKEPVVVIFGVQPLH